MNYLQLANRLKRRCRITGAVMTSVDNQVEEYQRVLDWINEAWVDLQLSRENWFWMRASASCPTVLNQAIYTPSVGFGLTNFGNWATDTFRTFETSAGQSSELRVNCISYDAWRDYWQFGATRFAASRPIEFCVTPQMALGVGPVPTAGYTLTADYYKVASELALATDTPALPPQFHMAIVYKAMMYYGASEAAPEVYQEGALEYRRFMNLLVMNQLEDFTMGGALA